MIGNKYNKLTVLNTEVREDRQTWCECLCDCGNTKWIRKQHLLAGTTKACGCVRYSRNGHTLLPEFAVFKTLQDRCNIETRSEYTNYGGRGIACEWDSFEQFYEDMGPRPTDKHTIERKDVNGNYCKENCIWTDDNSLQVFNQRKRKDNTSGKAGVVYEPERGSPRKWIARIYCKGSQKKKAFMTFEEAVEQRKEWELEFYGFYKAG